MLSDDTSPHDGWLENDGASGLTMADVVVEAQELLASLDESRHQHAALEVNWRKLWQLVREAKAAGLPFGGSSYGPWHLGAASDHPLDDVSPSLSADGFTVPIWPPEESRSATDLPGLLNWAGVPVPPKPFPPNGE